jgi:hypothetical protein
MTKTTLLLTAALAIGFTPTAALAQTEFTSPDCSIATIDRADHPCAMNYGLLYAKHPDAKIFHYQEGKDWIYNGEMSDAIIPRPARMATFTFEKKEWAFLTQCKGQAGVALITDQTAEQTVDELGESFGPIRFGTNMVAEQLYRKVCK